MGKSAFSRTFLVLLTVLLLVGQTGFLLGLTSSSPTTQNYLNSSATSLSPSLAILGAGAKWAAGNGSSVLFVDWKDNWVNHHLTDGALWGPWPLEESMDNWTGWISDALKSNGLNVQLTGDIPDNLTGYDLVVLNAYWAIEPRHEPLLQEFIANGGGVVFLSGTTELLRHYCKDWWTYRCPLDNTSALTDELLGSDYYINTGGFARVVVDSPFNTSLVEGSVLLESSGWSNAAVSGLHNDSYVVATWDSGLVFAYTHQYGSGRVYYQADFTDQATFQNPPPPNPPPLPPPPSNSTNPIIVRIEPEQATVKRDQVFSVSVVVENLPADPGAAGIQFIITWDPKVLNGVSLSDVVFHEVTPTSEYGNIWKIWDSVNDSCALYAFLWVDSNLALEGGYLPISGNHTVATIELKAMTEGVTTLHFSNVIVADMKGNPLVHRSTGSQTVFWNNVIVDSTITVGPPLRDLGGNGFAGAPDATLFGSHFGSRPGDSNWYAAADLNGDLEVDILDAIILSQISASHQDTFEVLS